MDVRCSTHFPLPAPGGGGELINVVELAIRSGVPKDAPMTVSSGVGPEDDGTVFFTWVEVR